MLTPPVPVIRMPDAAGALSAADPLVGIDIVAIRRIRSSLERFGDRFVDRLYTPGEAAYAMAAPACRAQRLAARFAAKEAVIKALGFGGQALCWRDIEVIRHDSGACAIALHGQAARRARERRVGAIAVSLSHDDDYAIAVVHATRRRPRPPSFSLLAS